MNVPRLVLLASLSAAAVAGGAGPKVPVAEPLYFAVEVAERGQVVARPKLLGEAGKPILVERWQLGLARPAYRLVLDPSPSGDGYRVKLDLSLPKAQGRSELELLHGEQRRVELGEKPGDLRVSLMMMRVDSPEFRALMDLGNAI